ncbi:MAG: hypothetical protein GY869_26515, partial [Planctomycetes bacterium]|nr:hypothetical protein [Planctomycetota bacterium]
RNTGPGFEDSGIDLPGVRYSSAAWGDYDNDGHLDILLTGRDSGNDRVSKIYRNTGGDFEDSGIDLPGVYYSSVAWGDYDNDGDLDILLTGEHYDSGYQRISKIYRNTGPGFEDSGIDLPGVRYSSAAWGDYDNDGHLDILLTGWSDNGKISKIYVNIRTIPNTAPVAPAAICHIPLAPGHQLGLNWNPGNDAETAAVGLSYNLHLSGVDTNLIVIPAMALDDGWRLIPTMGSQNQNTFWPVDLNDYPNGDYHYRVQAIDHGYAGSEFTTAQTFHLRQVSGLVWDDLNNDGIQVYDEPGLDSVLVRFYLPNPDLPGFARLNLDGSPSSPSPTNHRAPFKRNLEGLARNQNKNLTGLVAGFTVLREGYTLWDSTWTDSAGVYIFPKKVDSAYALEFVLPLGYTAFTDSSQGNDFGDSDVSPTTGMIDFSLGNSDLDFDAGMLAWPVLVNALPDTTLDEDATTVLEKFALVTAIFQDPIEGGNLTFSFPYHSNPALIDPFIENIADSLWLNLTITPNGFGVDTLVVRGTDSGDLFADDTLVVTIHSVNDPLILTVGGDISYTEGNEPIVINNTLTISDVDSDSLTAAEVTIARGFKPDQDILA